MLCLFVGEAFGMNLSKLNNSLGLITNIGVILGLILVAYELQQTQIAISTEVYATGREGWSNWSAMIVENSEVAQIWLSGNAGEELTAVEKVRYRRLVGEWLWIHIQMFDQWTRVDGEPADWVIQRLVGSMKEGPGLTQQIVQELGDRPESGFTQHFRSLYPDLR